MPGRARSQSIAFQQHHVGHAHLGQVVERAAAQASSSCTGIFGFMNVLFFLSVSVTLGILGLSTAFVGLNQVGPYFFIV